MKVLDQLFTDFPMSPQQLRILMLTAPYRYKFFHIPKRSGGRRLISQPAKEVKWLQRYVIEIIRKKIPVHRCATAYEPGSSIFANAEAHVQNRFLLKMDFKNFFPSITDMDVSHLIKSAYPDIEDGELELIVRLLVMSDKKNEKFVLAAGAPSSPFISNALLNQFDTELHLHCLSQNVVYTRYADDIALSTNAPLLLSELHKFIRVLVNEMKHPVLKINEEKTVYTSKKHNRKVTGLTLNSQKQVSLGRDMKRELRAAVDKFRKNELSQEAVSTLRGKLAFALAVEPEFVLRLRTHYTDEVITRLFQS
ncbi:Retron-type RNA-directed DNA polymerase [Collimonas arenae]|uniref:RNA-directed DNA polymerase n=1 Tax=Collimonas arenae TaxID=279058 RepID=A0A0A1FH29_9BURK|nr:retron St85 family RNA-directed DNA polymerase [Collimonas arenae]AIY43871.1 Retron-type RNA-directed DNA polymerase [Collimonas arenae]